jgi:hypothetical protein
MPPDLSASRAFANARTARQRSSAHRNPSASFRSLLLTDKAPQDRRISGLTAYEARAGSSFGDGTFFWRCWTHKTLPFADGCSV